ncbi:hypothetical protein [Streptomyces vastus]|uniref:Uncharacterized protein n=1 Tax=Streptomyces vastus TaxID=285451 RepID=A0ABN3QPW3_9ACTN
MRKGHRSRSARTSAGARLRVARVTAVDPERRTVAVTGEDGDGELGYDTLLPAPVLDPAHLAIRCRPASAIRGRSGPGRDLRRLGGGSRLRDGGTGSGTDPSRCRSSHGKLPVFRPMTSTTEAQSP